MYYIFINSSKTIMNHQHPDELLTRHVEPLQNSPAAEQSCPVSVAQVSSVHWQPCHHRFTDKSIVPASSLVVQSFTSYTQDCQLTQLGLLWPRETGSDTLAQRARISQRWRISEPDWRRAQLRSIIAPPSGAASCWIES